MLTKRSILSVRVAFRGSNPFFIKPSRCSTISNANSKTKNVDAQNLNSAQLMITQHYGPDRTQNYNMVDNLLVKGDGTLIQKNQQNNTLFSVSDMKSRAKLAIHDVVSHFLPKGYPTSVAKGYLTFVQGQVISVTMSSAGGVLSMQALLSAIGVGSGSIPLAATLNWIIKDGLGQLGGVIFASIVSNRFDADPKRWRMLAAISMDVSSFIELLTPLAPSYFLLIASVANVGKNISFLAASASRAAIHKTFATHENLADVTAKSGSQSILSSMLGTSLGVSLAAMLGTNHTHCVLAFLACSSISLMATYRSMQAVTLTTLSLKRLDYIFEHAVNDACSNKWEGIISILTPDQMRANERFLSVNASPMPGLVIGPDVDRVISSSDEWRQLLACNEGNNYIVGVRTASDYMKSSVFLLLREHANKDDLLTGLLHSFLVRRELSKHASVGVKITDPITSDGEKLNVGMMNLDVVRKTRQMIETKDTRGVSLKDAIMTELHNSPWIIEELLLEPRFARISVKT